MKNITLIFLLFYSIVFAKTELSVSVGKESFSNKENLISPTSMGIRGDFYLDDLYHLDFGYDNLGSVARKGSSTKIDIDRFYTQFSADGEEEYHVVPTLSIGAGYERQKGLNANSQPFLSLGVGFRYNVSNNFNFVFGTKALWKTDDSVINYTGSFGLGYMLDDEPVNNEKEKEEVIIPKKKLDLTPQKTKVLKKKCCIAKSFKPEKTQAKLVPPITDLPTDDTKVGDEPIVLDDKEMAVKQNTKIVKKSIKPTIKNGYFIQVGAYQKYRPTAKLNRLAKSGYHIILRHRGSMTKILLGPYESRDITYKKLNEVKKIVPQAFLYKGI